MLIKLGGSGWEVRFKKACLELSEKIRTASRIDLIASVTNDPSKIVKVKNVLTGGMVLFNVKVSRIALLNPSVITRSIIAYEASGVSRSRELILFIISIILPAIASSLSPTSTFKIALTITLATIAFINLIAYLIKEFRAREAYREAERITRTLLAIDKEFAKAYENLNTLVENLVKKCTTCINSGENRIYGKTSISGIKYKVVVEVKRKNSSTRCFLRLDKL